MSYVVPVPAAKAIVSSLKGKRVHPVTGEVGKEHNGLDFAVGTGTPVFAPTTGVVARTFFDDKGGGNVIFLDHDDGKRSAFLHLSKFLVTAGQRVKAGQQIAESGATGVGTGAHLHFEVRQRPSDARLDPLDFLPGSFVVTDSLAKELGRKTVSGKAAIGLGTLLFIGAAAYLWKNPPMRKRRA